MMNLQIVHQIVNGLGFISAGLSAALLYAGCTQPAVGALDCSTTGATWAPWLGAVAAGLFFIKPLLTIMQGGPAALVRPITVMPKRTEDGKFKRG